MPAKPDNLKSTLREGSLTHQVVHLFNSAVDLARSEVKVTQLAGEEFIHSATRSIIMKIFGILVALIGVYSLTKAFVLFLNSYFGLSYCVSNLIVGFSVIGLGLIIWNHYSLKKTP